MPGWAVDALTVTAEGTVVVGLTVAVAVPEAPTDSANRNTGIRSPVDRFCDPGVVHP